MKRLTSVRIWATAAIAMTFQMGCATVSATHESASNKPRFSALADSIGESADRQIAAFGSQIGENLATFLAQMPSQSDKNACAARLRSPKRDAQGRFMRHSDPSVFITRESLLAQFNADRRSRGLNEATIEQLRTMDDTETLRFVEIFENEHPSLLADEKVKSQFETVASAAEQRRYRERIIGARNAQKLDELSGDARVAFQAWLEDLEAIQKNLADPNVPTSVVAQLTKIEADLRKIGITYLTKDSCSAMAGALSAKSIENLAMLGERARAIANDLRLVGNDSDALIAEFRHRIGCAARAWQEATLGFPAIERVAQKVFGRLFNGCNVGKGMFGGDRLPSAESCK